MNRNIAVGLLGAAVGISSVVLMTGATSAWLVAVSGFFFVVGGTLLTAVLSEGYPMVESLFSRLPTVFAEPRVNLGADQKAFLEVATHYRRGGVRSAEMAVKRIGDAFLQLGSQLVIDRCSVKDISRTLHWHVSNTQEQERRELRVLQSMGGFAPAFGMLGTLLGLVHVLFGLGESELDAVGSAIGFAMITTVYGLVSSSLIIKPAAIKLEQRLREQLAWQRVKYELIMLLHDNAHPTVMQDTLNAFASGAPMPVTAARSASGASTALMATGSTA